MGLFYVKKSSGLLFRPIPPRQSVKNNILLNKYYLKLLLNKTLILFNIIALMLYLVYVINIFGFPYDN